MGNIVLLKSKCFSWKQKRPNLFCHRPKICWKTRFWGRFVCQRLLSIQKSTVLVPRDPQIRHFQFSVVNSFLCIHCTVTFGAGNDRPSVVSTSQPEQTDLTWFSALDWEQTRTKHSDKKRQSCYSGTRQTSLVSQQNALLLGLFWQCSCTEKRFGFSC